jgi:hypothetical protein
MNYVQNHCSRFPIDRKYLQSERIGNAKITVNTKTTLNPPRTNKQSILTTSRCADLRIHVNSMMNVTILAGLALAGITGVAGSDDLSDYDWAKWPSPAETTKQFTHGVTAAAPTAGYIPLEADVARQFALRPGETFVQIDQLTLRDWFSTQTNLIEKMKSIGDEPKGKIVGKGPLGYKWKIRLLHEDKNDFSGPVIYIPVEDIDDHTKLIQDPRAGRGLLSFTAINYKGNFLMPNTAQYRMKAFTKRSPRIEMPFHKWVNVAEKLNKIKPMREYTELTDTRMFGKWPSANEKLMSKREVRVSKWRQFLGIFSKGSANEGLMSKRETLLSQWREAWFNIDGCTIDSRGNKIHPTYWEKFIKAVCHEAGEPYMEDYALALENIPDVESDIFKKAHQRWEEL